MWCRRSCDGFASFVLLNVPGICKVLSLSSFGWQVSLNLISGCIRVSEESDLINFDLNPLRE